MSLLAAFVAMLGKQWLNRYLRHAGGSMIERCGDRQRKLDGLEKWPFRLFIESLPVMLQIALLLLSCGLSRYVWSVNTSVAHVVISFTVLGVIFYLGIVIAGTSSYACPFQTPASTTLRALRGKGMTWRPLASLSLSRIISFVYIAWRDVWQGLTSRYCRIRNTMIDLWSWRISLPSISSMAKRIWHQIIILLLHIDQAFGNAKHRLVQKVQRYKHAILLPIVHGDVDNHPHTLQPRDGLLVPVRNITSLQERNAANARCVCWIIRNITDPEAIESAIRLAGMIHWFDGNVDVDPPFGFIVSTFEACFDSARKPYPGMIDRAYFSGRAILQINTAAKLQSQECASNYPFPHGYHYQSSNITKDLDYVLYWFLPSSNAWRGLLDSSSMASTPAHLMWMSNMHVDITRAIPGSFMRISLSTTNNTTPLDHVTDANAILSWYIYLGGLVEEETLWADDKS
jgi:hypothetical protein